MVTNPQRTKCGDMRGIEFPIIACTRCKDAVSAVVNAGGFAVLGEPMWRSGGASVTGLIGKNSRG